MFDPQPHLIKLPRKVKDHVTGHYTTVYEDYLEVKWRLCWFRDRYPPWPDHDRGSVRRSGARLRSL
jgi:hypothetical protein